MKFRKIGPLVKALSLIIICIVMLTAIKIVQYGNQFSDTASDAAIILGAATWGDKPSPVFQARIDHGVNLHQQGKVKYLIFTGGIGKNQKLSESEVARTYAVAQGISKNSIFIETQSKITFENLEQAKTILDAKNLDTVLLVSDPLHMKRAMSMTHDLNINAKPSPTPYSLYKSTRKKISFLAREVFFYLGYLIFG